jgi:hypothetical protein
MTKGTTEVAEVRDPVGAVKRVRALERCHPELQLLLFLSRAKITREGTGSN